LSSENNRIIYGRHPIMEALKAEIPLDKIYMKKGIQRGFLQKVKKIAARRKIPFVSVDEAALKRMCGNVNHQGIAAIPAFREYDSLDDVIELARIRGEDPFLLVLNEVQDTHNLGSLIRTAMGAGVHGAIIGRHRCAQLSPVVSKVAAGADSRLKVARVTNIADTLNELKEMGLFIIGTDSDGQNPYYEGDFSGPLALVMGGEEKGLGVRVRKACDVIVRIPLSGEISSLNVGVAGGIILFFLRECRRNLSPKME